MLLISFGLTSCSPIFTSLYGIKKINSLEEKTIVRYAEKYNIPSTESFMLDTTYFTYLFSLDTNGCNEEIKNHSQPLQTLYYDNTGSLKSFQLNCYAGGFPNLDWKSDELMSTFPPKQQAPVDSIVQLKRLLKYLNPLQTEESIKPDKYDYIVVVFWNRFMGRQSKRLIRVVQENSQLAKGKKVRLVYANTDNLFAYEEE